MKFSKAILPIAGLALGTLASVAGAQTTSKPSQEAMKPTAAMTAAPAAAASEPRRIEIPEVQARVAASKPVMFVDARGAISGNMIKGAVHAPLAEVDKWAASIPKDTFIVAYCACHTEGTSLAFVRRLGELGFTNAYALKGGIVGWEEAKLPVEPAPAQ